MHIKFKIGQRNSSCFQVKRMYSLMRGIQTPCLVHGSISFWEFRCVKNKISLIRTSDYAIAWAPQILLTTSWIFQNSSFRHTLPVLFGKRDLTKLKQDCKLPLTHDQLLCNNMVPFSISTFASVVRPTSTQRDNLVASYTLFRTKSFFS